MKYLLTIVAMLATVLGVFLSRADCILPITFFPARIGRTQQPGSSDDEMTRFLQNRPQKSLENRPPITLGLASLRYQAHLYTGPGGRNRAG